MQDEVIDAAHPFPTGRFRGAGIVIAAGGPRYFTCAWVCLTILRRVLGCVLPIQVWYLGPDEMSAEMIELLRPFDVDCVDALAVRERYPTGRLGGWELKPYAILNCPFREVIYLDADNVPLIDPALLLSRTEYRRTGALFWPDVRRLARDCPIWEICRVPYRDEPEFESGQMVVDKERSWAALQLTMHMNEMSDFYYRHVLGDKETFHMAWRMLDQPFSMPPFPPRHLVGRVSPNDYYPAGVLHQHDFNGQVIFHHRVGPGKWIAWGENLRVPGFPYEETCMQALRELRQQWGGRVVPFPPHDATALPAEAGRRQSLYVLYCRVGSDQRVLEFLPGGKIGAGRGGCEQTWRLEEDQGSAVLVIEGDHGVTCRLTLDSDGVWRGRWLHYEQMPVEIVPRPQEAIAPPSGAR